MTFSQSSHKGKTEPEVLEGIQECLKLMKRTPTSVYMTRNMSARQVQVLFAIGTWLQNFVLHSILMTQVIDSPHLFSNITYLRLRAVLNFYIYVYVFW